MGIVDVMLLWCCVIGFSKAYRVIVAVENCVVELHEVISTNEQIVKALLAYIEGANGVLTLVFLIFIRADFSLHPMVGWNWVVNSIDDICEFTKTELIRCAVISCVLWIVIFELCLGPFRHCEQRGTRIWSE